MSIPQLIEEIVFPQNMQVCGSEVIEQIDINQNDSIRSDVKHSNIRRETLRTQIISTASNDSPTTPPQASEKKKVKTLTQGAYP